MIRIIVLALLTEALVELFFKAAPLQSIRFWLMDKTPFLDTKEYGHLLECKYCVSVWFGFGVVFLSYFDCVFLRFAVFFIITARLSNFIHILFGVLKDAQMNMRLRR